MKFINLLSLLFITNIYSDASPIQTTFNVSLNQTTINNNNQDIITIGINIHDTVYNNLQSYVDTIHHSLPKKDNYDQLNRTKNIYKINKIYSECTDNIIINVDINKYNMTFNQIVTYINYINLKPLFGNYIDYVCSYSLTSISENVEINSNNYFIKNFIIISVVITIVIALLMIFIFYKIYKRDQIDNLENSQNSHNLENFQNFHNSQNAQNFQNSQNSQNSQNFQNIEI